MKRNEIINKLIECIKSTNKHCSNITLDSALSEDLGYDSLLIVDLLVQIEDTFNISLFMEDISINNLVTVNDLLKAIMRAINDETLWFFIKAY